MVLLENVKSTAFKGFKINAKSAVSKSVQSVAF